MKHFFLLISLVLSCLSLQAQALSNEEIKQRINAATAATNSISCDFIQTKHLSLLGDKMVSKGRMAYKQTDKLRWEYLAPYEYLFILNGKRAYIKESGKACKAIDTDKSRVFRLVTKVMREGISGKSLDDERNFKVDIQQDALSWTVRLTPIRGNVKAMFQSMLMYYDAKTVMAQKAELIESNGDRTIIEFKNIKQNGALSDQLFVAE